MKRDPQQKAFISENTFNSLKTCRLVPNNKNQYCLEIYADDQPGSVGERISTAFASSRHLDLESEFSAEFFLPLRVQLKELLAKALTVIKKDQGIINVNTVKIFVKGSLVLIIPIYILINTSPLSATEDKLSMTYLYLGTESQQMDYIARTEKSLDTISPDYFSLNTEGHLVLNDISANFIAYAHGQGLKVTPCLTNGWDRAKGQTALVNMEQLARDLSETIINYNLDGINVDLENLTQNERDSYTAFIKLLNDSLPQNKEITVAVAPNPGNWTTGWQASYDYSALAKYADYLVVMAYDEHYGGSSAGPVASIGFVENSLKYALTKTTPEKIVLGLPFYGRIWSTDSSNISGRGLTLTTIRAIIDNYDAQAGYSKEYGSAYARFSVTASDPVISFSGTTLKPGHYIIWYENSDSLKEKLALVQKYDIKGAGSWSLGEETADVWDYYSLWLNGKYFADIENSFAKDAIIKAATAGLMTGVSQNEFGPMQAITRAQAAAIFCRALNLSPSQDLHPFSDISGHWAEAEIKTAYEAGLVFGYEDGTFRPNDKLTREEVAVLLARIVNLSSLENDSTDITFSDIAKDRWSYEEISALANANILRGYENGIFAPARVLSREEMAALLERIEDYLP